jgi:catechol 2,3-dioxygenase-like lactoylglutathione lyase family enzyme
MFNYIDYVMVMVSDMGRSVKFYRDTLGLRLRSESPDWTEFETGATVLALHGGGKAAVISREPQAGTASIGFYVDNLDDKFNELKGRGVPFIMPPTDRTEEKIKLAVCLDPDGLPISLAERKQ